MADYDLVVVGNNAVAPWAAIAAKEQSARVALIAVAQAPIPYHLLLQQWVQTQPSMALTEWVKAMALRLQASYSPAKLASLGIEQIDGIAQFKTKPQFQVHCQNRVLRAHRYLLCLDADLSAPDVPGSADWLSPADVLTRLENLHQPLADPVLVVGDGPVAVSLSQSLGRLGHSVHLLCSLNQILPGEDAEAAWRVQAHLEADHVNIHTHSQIKDVTPSSSSYQVTTNQGKLMAGSLVWAVETTSAIINPNQIAVDLRHTAQGLWVNPRLQTSHSQVYACGSVLGGYTLADIARHEAGVAVNNALGARQAIEYSILPWTIPTMPELARVGLTETLAQEASIPFRCFYHTYQQSDKGQPQDQTGWCKVLVHKNGQTLGAHMVGIGAAEVVHLIALAMQQRCPVSELTGLGTFSSSYGSLVGQIARQGCQQ